MTGVVFGSYKRAMEWFERGLSDFTQLEKPSLKYYFNGEEYILLYARDLNDCHNYSGMAFSNIMFEDELSDEIKGFFRTRIFPRPKLTKLEEALKLIEEYESISIGIDVGVKDGTAIMVAEADKKGESVYILHSRTYFEGDSEYIKLKDLIELKKKDVNNK
jgi:hypothetical protein